MGSNLKKNIHIHIRICITESFAVQLKLIQHCKLTTLQKRKKNSFKIETKPIKYLKMNLFKNKNTQDFQRENFNI